ncbi:D-3-phosphoglycerate dehydrogenase [Arcanobacterium pluranimalium]|uniref:phosphoglycerate dehydrogenase n=1 Tax=Arcanobacterium pluranimalium TaxID=108028 RepID=UPI00195C2524|nr:D-3-phosphoglycerate dehydrogenase [Arcanobacterium pluranimalium]
MTKILLLENPHTSADEIFHKRGYEIRRISGALDEDELIAALDCVDVLGLRSKTFVTQRVIESAPSLTAIGAFCIGTNQIDLHAASEHGIAVFNAPYSNTRSVVEMVIGELIALTRQIPQRNDALHRGIWEKSADGSHEVRGKTLGIIGYGSIGSQLSVVAEAIGMNVVFYDIAEKLALGNAQRTPTLDALLAQSDVVSLHIDGRASNTNFFSRAMFDKMKRGSVFINLSRGHIVDLEALREKLIDGTIAGAGIDVFPEEPNANGDHFESCLAEFPNVILTPHIGGSTLEAQESIGQFVSTKLVNYLHKGETDMSVNLPNLASSPAEDALYRVAWVHRNTPGALARVNQLFANAGANITYQSLATEGEYGYMVTDSTTDIPELVLEELQQSPMHVRLRVLRKG